jgi:hypothetical protein
MGEAKEAVQVVNNTEAGRFEAVTDAGTAYAEYRLLASGILFPHTEVPAAMEGQGIGSALVKAGLAFAREKELKVMPVCTFFAGYIARHPETHELVHPDYRTALGI